MRTLRSILLLLLVAPFLLQAQDASLKENFLQAKALWATQGDREGATTKFEQVLAVLEPKRQSLEPTWHQMLCETYNWLAVLDDRAAARKAQAPKRFEAILDINPDFDIDRTITNNRLQSVFDNLKAAKFVKLSLALEPSDGLLTVDGKASHVSVSTKFLPPGPHTLTYNRPGYQSAQIQVDLALKAPKSAEIKLTRTSSAVTFYTAPIGTEVFLDGKPLGQTAGCAPAECRPMAEKAGLALDQLSAGFTVDNLTAGEHVLELRAPCFKSKLLKLGADYATPFADHVLEPVKLDPSRSFLTVNSATPGGELILNGKPMGAIPVKDLLVCPGVCNLQVRFPAGGFSRVITFLEDGSMVIDAKPRPRLAYLGFIGDETFAGRDRILSLLAKMGEQLTEVAFLPPRPGENPTDAAERIRGSKEAELLLTAQPVPGKPIHQVMLRLSTLSPGEEETLVVKPLEQDPLASLVARLNHAPVLSEPWAGVTLLDVPGEAGPWVLQAEEATIKAGVQIAKPILKVNGKPVADTVAFREAIRALPATITINQGGADVKLPVTQQSLELPIGASNLCYPAVLANLRLRALSAKGNEAGLSRLNQALALMHFRLYDRAMEILRDARVASTTGLGQGTLDYYAGICLLRLGNVYLPEAQQAFQAAMKDPNATLFGPTGPRVAPLAKQALEDLKP